MPESPGIFVVLEGLDGAGTTTQAEKLHEYCTGRGLNSFLTFEPTGEPIGKLIRDAISGKLDTTDGALYSLSERELCLLFAADRLSHSKLIDAKRAAGARVICDRYVFSSMAYQSLDSSVPAEWVAEVNDGCAVPDITLFLSVPIDECLRRIAERNEDPTAYERTDLLDKIDANYKRLAAYYERTFGPLVIIDGAQPPETVHASIVEALASRLPR